MTKNDHKTAAPLMVNKLSYVNFCTCAGHRSRKIYDMLGGNV